MKNVDDDGEIVFDEFLNLVSSSKGGKSSNLIQDFFKKMMDGKFPAFTN